MASALNRFIVSCSASWWKVLLLLAGQAATLFMLLRIENGFPAVSSGNIPFDMQNELTVAQVFTQLHGYSEQAFANYYLFQVIDFAFPLLGGLLMAAIFAFGLRHAAPGWYAVAKTKNLLVLMLLPPLFDYLENLNFLWVVSQWPAEAIIAAQLGVIAKQAKLLCLNIVFAITALAIVVALGRWVGLKTGLIRSSG